MEHVAIKSLIREVPDFPKPGILFKDISPFLKSAEALEYFAERLFSKDVVTSCEYFAGVEARGFILASLLASHHKKGIIPIRKAGKLPPPVMAEAYALEYGNAIIEMNPGKGKIILVDDVLATGGTLTASINLCQKSGYDVVDVGVLIDLRFLNQFKFNGKAIQSLVQY